MSIVVGGRLFEDRRPCEEEEQLEKKRSGKGLPFEEEPKRQKVEVVAVDSDYYEGDTDSDSNPDDDDEKDDFTEIYYAVETYRWKHKYCPIYPDEEIKGRRCLDVVSCHRDQHVEEFEGLPIFELFKVRVRLNQSSPLQGPLYGTIVTKPYGPKDENPNPISYYRVSKQEADFITLDSVNKTILLPLSSPQPRPPISNNHTLAFVFAFKLGDKDIFYNGYPYKDSQLFDDGFGNYTAQAEGMYVASFNYKGPFIKRFTVGEPSLDPILMGAYFSVFYGAWATVDVKFLNKGVSSFHGFIFARPCVFFRRIRLLSIQPGQTGEVEGESGSVKLTRSVVAVPSNSSLIIGAVLYDQGGKLIIRGKTFFPAREKGIASGRISHEGVDILEVTLQWKCES